MFTFGVGRMTVRLFPIVKTGRGEESGRGEWARRVGEESGREEWARRVGEKSGREEWVVRSNTLTLLAQIFFCTSFLYFDLTCSDFFLYIISEHFCLRTSAN
jgi:hypothetical protein